MNATQIIDALGGTFEVAKLCQVKPPSVSEWRKEGIPPASNGQVKIVHRKTGLVTESTVKKINSWAVSQLRNELVIKRQTATA